MERMDTLPEDYDLLRVKEDLETIYRVAARADEEKKILGAALLAVGQIDDSEVKERKGHFGYIPLDLNSFFSLIYDLERALSEDPDYRHTDKKHRPCSFLEVGCGPGRNLHILRATDRFTFDKIVGFDVVEDYVNHGKKVFGLDENIFVDDALTFDYAPFDVVYFYKPFSEDTLQRKFEKRLIETMKSGAYIAAYMDVSLEKSRKLVLKGDAHSIWKKL